MLKLRQQLELRRNKREKDVTIKCIEGNRSIIESKNA